MASKKAAVAAADVYSIQELAENAHIFNTRPEVVTAALREQSITKTTEANARTIVAAFLKREVK